MFTCTLPGQQYLRYQASTSRHRWLLVFGRNLLWWGHTRQQNCKNKHFFRVTSNFICVDALLFICDLNFIWYLQMLFIWLLRRANVICVTWTILLSGIIFSTKQFAFSRFNMKHVSSIIHIKIIYGCIPSIQIYKCTASISWRKY